jgi:hypothetical protein
MNRLPKPITWQIQNLLAAIEYAAKKLFFSVDRKNMNRRPLTESLDDKIMGEVATVAVVEYLRSMGIQAASYDQFRIDGFERLDPGWDILFGPGTYGWIETDDRSEGRPTMVKTASIKSSRLPNGDSLQAAITKRDFKILVKPGQSLEQSLTADIEMQVYFERQKSWLPKGVQVTADEVHGCMIARENCTIVLEKLNIVQRFGVCSLTAWHGREQIVLESAKLKQAQWTSYHAGSGKKMWCAPLKHGFGFEQIKNEVTSR